MKTLALIGSPGIEMTAHYARLIGEEVRQRFGDGRPANVLSVSLPSGAPGLTAAAKFARAAGAESALLCSSPLNVLAEKFEALPVISMTASVIDALRRAKISRVGMIGTRSREEEQYWQQSLRDAGQIESLLPLASDRRHLLEVIDREFFRGVVTEAARADVLRIVHSLRQAGARAVVVCTPELTEVLQDSVPLLPVFDVAELHTLAAVNWMTRSDVAESSKPKR